MLLTRFLQVKFEPKGSGPNPVLVLSLFFPNWQSHQIGYDHSQGFLVHPNSLPRVIILLGNIPTQARCMNSDAFETLHITLVAICHQWTNQNQVNPKMR
jgi:hypothetical protein